MSHKLTKKKEIEKVYEDGVSSYNVLTGVKAIKNNLKKNRFGIIISTKISKKATDRNRIKRQIREILKKEEKKIKSSNDCVIITRPGILKKNYNEIESSIQKNFKKLKLYKEKK